MPIDIPFSGLLLGCETPSIVTLFRINVVPFGIGSVSTIFVEETVPVFCKLIVYVIISPMSTKVRLADFVGLTVAVLTATVVGVVGSVVVTGGLVDLADTYMSLKLRL